MRIMCKLNLFGWLLDCHKRLQYVNNYNHWKLLDSVSNLSYSFFSNPNPKHLPQHYTLSPNHQFSQRIWFEEYYSAYVPEVSMDRIGYTAGYLWFFGIRIGYGYLFLKKIGSGQSRIFDWFLYSYSKNSKWFCHYVLHSSQSVIIRVTSS